MSGPGVAIEAIEAYPGTTRIERDALAGDGAVRWRALPEVTLSANRYWLAVGVGLSTCEIKQVTSFDSRDAQIAALTYGHDVNEVVKVLDSLVVNAKWWGAKGDGTTSDSAAIQAALTSLAALGGGVCVLPGHLTYLGNITFPGANLELRGEGRPIFNAGITALQYGTIVKGTISLNGYANCAVRDLGVDVSASAANGISSGAQGTGRKDTLIENVAVLGSARDNTYHGIVLTSGGYNTIRDVWLAKNHHNIALRGVRNVVDGAHIGDGSTSIIVKGAGTSGAANYCTISNVIIEGSAADQAGPVEIEAAENYDARFITISNVTGVNTTPALIYINENAAQTGVCQNIAVNNCTSNDNGGEYGAFTILNASYVTLANCHAYSPNAYSFYKDSVADEIHVLGGVSVGAGTADWSGDFNSLEINGRGGIAARVHVADDTDIADSSWADFASWDTEDYDRCSFWASGTKQRFTFQKTGRYRCHAHISFEANATGIRGARFERDDAATVGATVVSPVDGTNPAVVDAFWEQNFTAAQWMELQLYQSSGDVLGVLAAGSYMSVEKVGD